MLSVFASLFPTLIHFISHISSFQVKMELLPGLGLGTKLGLFGHLRICMGLHTKLWVLSLGIAWEGVWHPRPLRLWVGLGASARDVGFILLVGSTPWPRVKHGRGCK